MKNKPTFVAVVLAASTLLFANYTVLKTAGSHPGSTGAPGDLTCAQTSCHSDAQVVQDPVGINTLLFSSSDSTYIPGQTYTLTLQVVSSHTSKFGFELTALRDFNNTNTGTLGILEPIRTQLINHTLGTDLRTSVTHETAGTVSLSPGFTEWKMKWTAPSTNAGPITFYYATNCTNNNSLETGDIIYLSSFGIKPALTTNTDKVNLDDINGLTVFFNRDLREIILNYGLYKPAQVKTLVSDCKGVAIFEGVSSLKSGEQSEKIKLSPEYTKGTYIVRIIAGDDAVTRKIIID